jgi:hypothetical protein
LKATSPGEKIKLDESSEKLEENVRDGVKYISQLKPGLPDGIFSKQKSQFWSIWEGHGMEKFGIFYCHLEYIKAIGI